MPRDMTDAEFRRALRRNGFRVVLFWIDRPKIPGLSVGMIIDQKGRIHRRATIAHAIKLFAEHDAAEAKARRAPTPPLLEAMGAK